MKLKAALLILAAALALLSLSAGPAWGIEFEPFVAYPTSSWPEAVDIGDVTSDGLNDVLMSTTFYFDPENDYKLFLFAQTADGSFAPKTRLDTDIQYGDYAGVVIADLTSDGHNDAAIGT